MADDARPTCERAEEVVQWCWDLDTGKQNESSRLALAAWRALRPEEGGDGG